MEHLCEGLLLGMGNPLLDISATVEDSFLKKYNMKPDDAIMADELHKPLYKELQEVYKTEFIAGGSVQNSLRVAQWILEKPKVTTYFGSVGTDEYAKILQDRATADGVNVKYQYTDAEPTGTCAVLITGTHRSLCANLAAANLFTEEHLIKPDNKKLIEAAKYYYVSGFFLAVSPPSIMNIAKHSLANDHTFLMNLSAPFVSQFYKKDLSAVLPYVDILFGNETEAHTFAKEFNIEEEDLKCIALKLCQHPKQNEKKGRVVVITQGCDPVLLARDGDVTEIPVTALTKEQIVDTNGAGDAFVGGFLAQLVLEQPYEKCVKCGIYAASNIIKQSGCTFSGKSEFTS